MKSKLEELSASSDTNGSTTEQQVTSFTVNNVVTCCNKWNVGCNIWPSLGWSFVSHHIIK